MLSSLKTAVKNPMDELNCSLVVGFLLWYGIPFLNSVTQFSHGGVKHFRRFAGRSVTPRATCIGWGCFAASGHLVCAVIGTTPTSTGGEPHNRRSTPICPQHQGLQLRTVHPLCMDAIILPRPQQLSSTSNVFGLTYPRARGEGRRSPVVVIQN